MKRIPRLASLGATTAVALAVAYGMAVGAEEPSGGFPAQRPDYRGYILRCFDGYRARFFPKADSGLAGADNLHVAAMVAAGEVRAWQWTKHARYAVSAADRLRNIAAKVDAIHQANFFTPYPLVFAYQGLAAGQRLDDDLRQAMTRFVAKRLVPRDDTNLNNQTMIRACGLELAAQVWPRLKPARGWHEYALKIYRLLERTEDIPENSPNYNTFDLLCTFLLTDLLDKHELLDKKGIRAMFLRYRDEISPAGWIPPYGDAGDPSRPLDPNWPIHSPWSYYVSAFERAACQYGDPTLRWAALELARAGARRQPLGSLSHHAEDLFYMTFAADWADPTIVPQMPGQASQILTRRDFHRDQALDKLILCPARRPGNPFVLCDLYVGGYHGHWNQHGSVNYFEYRDFPLLTILGYNNRNPEHTNLLMIRPAGDTFPHMPGIFVPNAWHEARVPTSRLLPRDSAQPFLRTIDHVNMRVTGGPRGVSYWAAQLSLEGLGKRPIVLDDFHAIDGWGKSPRLTADGPDGQSALAWTLPKGVHFLEKTGFRRTFDFREYPILMLRWKLSNNDEQAKPLTLRVDDFDFHAHAIQLEPTLSDVKVEQRGRNQYANMRFSGWFTPDSSCRRQIVLTGGGVLVVRDVLLPGGMARGMVAGPIWHMGPTTEPTAGRTWFNSRGGSLELLVCFDAAPRRTFGRQTVDVWAKQHQQTVFAREPIVPGKALRFVSVLVPHSPSLDAAALAAKIAIHGGEQSCSVHGATSDGELSLEINDDGTWHCTEGR